MDVLDELKKLCWNGSERRVQAPSSVHAIAPPGLISVELQDDEEVIWQWTHFSNGRSVVTGYRIVKAQIGRNDRV